jgi:hypothetical protein
MVMGFAFESCGFEKRLRSGKATGQSWTSGAAAGSMIVVFTRWWCGEKAG